MSKPPKVSIAAAGRGLQHSSLRATNRRAVLASIAVFPGRSNADISRYTGLAPQTASAIVAELEAEGMVRRGDVLRGRRGQPATPLFLDPGGAFAIGVSIGWRSHEVVLMNLTGEVLHRHASRYAYPDATTIVADTAAIIETLLGRLSPDQRARLGGIGVASPTSVGRGLSWLGAPSQQAALWQALDAAAAIAAVTGHDAIWFNNGNAACWAELVAQQATRAKTFAHLFIGTFLGAGVISESTLWEGPTGNSANLGSMLVGGADGIEQLGHDVASMTALRRRLDAAGIAQPDGSIADWPWRDWESVVGPWIADAAAMLARIVFNTATIAEFESVVIDGAMPRPVLSRLVTATRARLDELPRYAFDPPPVVEGRVGAGAAALGAAELLIFRKYFSRALSHMQA